MEVEAKYTLTEPVSAERVEALDWGAYQLGERHTIDQHDTFFDTTELALSRTRHAVRLRTGGKQSLVTLKGPGSAVQGVHSREEWEEPTGDHDPGGWPESIRQKLNALIGAQTIEPLLAVHNRRRLWTLLRDGQILGEVALDEGEIAAGDQREPMHELEIELKVGTRDDLAAIGVLVQRQLPARPEDRSKFARGLALVRHAQSLPEAETTMQAAASIDEKRRTMSKSKSKTINLPTLPRDLEMLAELAPFDGSTSLALASRIMLAKHTHKLYGHLPDVLNGDDPHAVHQMRVATRRLRASLQSTAIAYKPKPVEALRKPLRRLARALGTVRDLDVLLIRLREDVQQLDSDRGEVEARIEQLQSERDSAHRKLVSELLSKRTVRLLNTLNDFLLRPLDEIQADDCGLPLLVRHHAGSAIWHEFEAVQRFETVMPRASSEQLHDLRIGCKHLRYTLELFEPALGRDAREIIKQVEAIQEHLGHIHDADVALAYFGVDAHDDHDAEPDQSDASEHNHDTTDQALVESYGSATDGQAPEAAAPESEEPEQILSNPRPSYAAMRLAERARLLHEFEPLWQQLNTTETRRSLGKSIAKL